VLIDSKRKKNSGGCLTWHTEELGVGVDDAKKGEATRRKERVQRT
jgi:hypothetical protein